MASLYRQSVPVLIKNLSALTGCLKKAEAFAAQSASPAEMTEKMLTFRLKDDMRPLPYQVQSCCNGCKFLIPRMAGGEDTFFEDDETTFEQLYARIDRTVELLKTIKEEDFNKDWDKEYILSIKMGSFRFDSKQTYISEFMLPNFHFHFSTAYCILRHLGAPIGAFDYLKDVFTKIETEEAK